MGGEVKNREEILEVSKILFIFAKSNINVML